MNKDNEKEIEQTKSNEDQTNETQKNDVATDNKQDDVKIDVETSEKSIKEAVIEALTGIFKSDEKKGKKEDNLIKEVVKDETEDQKEVTLSKEQLDAYIDEKAQAVIDKMAKTAKEKGIEQAQMMKKLEDVDPAYVEYVEYKLKEDKSLDIKDFLKNNPQFQKKMTTQETITKETGGRGVLNKNQLDILDQF